MKAILEFQLPEEREEHELVLSAGKLHGALWDLEQWIRGIWKHGSEEQQNMNIEQIREKFYEILNDNDVEL